jgi:hypothetical protein
MPTRSSTEIRWHGLSHDFQRSGLSQTGFCSTREISLHTFRKWLYGQKALAPGLESPEPVMKTRPKKKRTP